MSNFSVEDTYQSILSDLKAGKRPRLKLNSNEAAECVRFWQDCNESRDLAKLTSLLCVLDHSDHHSFEISQLFISSLNFYQNDKAMLVYLISGSIKHVTEWHGKKGDRAPMSYLNALKLTLKHEDLEVIEWSLRAAESLGSQVLLLKEDILGAKPSLLKKFNAHYKNINELIRFLGQRWEPR